MRIVTTICLPYSLIHSNFENFSEADITANNFNRFSTSKKRSSGVFRF